MIRAPLLMIGALAVVLGACGGMDVPPTSPGTASVAAITPGPLSMPAPTAEFLPGVNAAPFKEGIVEGLADGLNATCRDGDGTDDRMWTCSYHGEVAISFYGPSPAEVSAFRVVTNARREVDRRSWLRGYASIISVEVFEWVYDHFGTNETARVGDVWVQITHDATSDGVLISQQKLIP